MLRNLLLYNTHVMVHIDWSIAPTSMLLMKNPLQVPPMPPDQTRKVIERELGGVSLEDVFEWIDLEQPLGSASISQVHLLDF